MSRPTGESASAADLAALRTQVTPENVMLLHHGLLAEAQYIGDQVSIHLRWRVGEPGKDLVSPQAAKAFNMKIDTLRAQLDAYVEALGLMAAEMARTAHSYGHTEAELSASFGRFYDGYLTEIYTNSVGAQTRSGPGR